MYATYLKRLVRDIFDAAYDDDICGYTEQELAKRSGLSVSTVYKLRTGRTQDPRHQTIWKLCRAVKMNMKLARAALVTGCLLLMFTGCDSGTSEKVASTPVNHVHKVKIDGVEYLVVYRGTIVRHEPLRVEHKP